jgi:LysR family hydrogen peroxide-inducible transcriptional activator
MNIQQFQYILAVAEYKHFEQAADKCCITQSTLSTMISKFEDEIGFKIFDRKKKPVQLTNEGTVVIGQIKNVLIQIDQLQELTKEIKGEIAGTLTLSVIPTIAPFLLPLFLQDFALKFPGLKITVREETTAEIERKLKSRELDIGIVSIPLNNKEFEEYRLYDEPFLYFDAVQTSRKNIEANKIKFENLCLLEDSHCMRTQVLQFCDFISEQSNTILNFEYKAGSIDSLLRFVKANNASTLLPLLAVRDFSDQEKTHLRNFDDPVPYRSVGLVVHRHFVKKKLLRVLQQEIMQKILPILKQVDMEGKMLYPLPN